MTDISSALANLNVGEFTVSANVIVMPGAIFAYHAPRYRDLGYSPIPAFESGAWPKAWSQYCDQAAPPKQIEQWGKAHNSNITLACGHGGLVAIDMDTSDKAILAAALAALPHCRIARFGSKGFALLCRHLDPGVASGDKRFKSIYWADPAIAEPMAEVKASGQNIMVPPSVHKKTGKLYTWINAETGAQIIDPATRAPIGRPPPLAELPVIDDADIERFRAALAPWARPPRESQPKARKDSQRPSNKRLEAYARAGLRNQTNELAGLRDGRRTALFKGVCGLGWAVHHGIISEREFADAFSTACNHNGLIGKVGRRAVEKSIDSGLSWAENDQIPDLGESTKPKRTKTKIKTNGSTSEVAQDVETDNDAEIGSNRPVIEFVKGRLAECGDEAEAALRAAGVEIYRQGGELVRPVRIALRDNKHNEVQIPAITKVTAPMLRSACSRTVDWKKLDGRNKKLVSIDPPPDVVQEILSRKGEGPCWQTLAGVTSTPFLRADGTIAHKLGFDPMTGEYLMDPVPLPSNMPARPTEEDARRALSRLEKLIEEFPFVDPGKEDTAAAKTVSHSVALSFLLTPPARAAIAVSPLHATRAFAAGTGKSYLANIVSAIVYGDRLPIISAGKNEEEFEKRLSAMMMHGVRIFGIDNVNGVLEGELINQAISEGKINPRILGKSETPPITNVFTVFANGNNFRVAKDMTRRTLFCVMDAGLPEEELIARTFERDPVAMVLADRGRYIADCLIILRAHYLEGCPGTVDLEPYNGFDDWSNIVRGSLVWLGKEDPVKSLAVGRAEEPDGGEYQAFVENCAILFGIGESNGKTVVQMFEESKLVFDETDGEKEARAEIREVLKKFADFHGKIESVKVAKWFAKFKRKVYGERRLRLDSASAGKGKLKWFVDGNS
jgi:hypothetical protein